MSRNLTAQRSYEYKLRIFMEDGRESERTFKTFEEAKAMYDKMFPIINAHNERAMDILKITTIVELEYSESM